MRNGSSASASAQEEIQRLGLARGLMASVATAASASGARVDKQMAVQGDLAPCAAKVRCRGCVGRACSRVLCRSGPEAREVLIGHMCVCVEAA